jgi:hypothetical protein
VIRLPGAGRLRGTAAAAAICVAATLAPEAAHAQPASNQQPRRVYLGASVGGIWESSEDFRGLSGQAVAAGAIVGVHVTARWAIEGEIYRTGMLDGHHRDTWFNVGAVWRPATGKVRPYVVVGCCLVHGGIGVEVPVGQIVALQPGLHVSYALTVLHVHPQAALVVRF